MAPAFFVVLLLGCGARTALDEPRVVDAESRLDAALDAPPRLDSPTDARLLADVPRADAPSSMRDTSPGRDASRDVGRDAPATDAGSPCEVAWTLLRDPVCGRAVFAEEAVLSCPGGFVDVVAQGDGLLAWECDGDRATAVFGDRTYRGSRTGDTVALCIETEFDYLDGCRWRSSQRLEGDVSSGTLELSYREVAIAGTECFPPCSADARVVLR